MSINNCIKTILQIKEDNLYFCSEKPITEEFFNLRRCQVYHATYTYTPKYCPHCKKKTKGKIKKIGFATVFVRLPNVVNMKTYMRLRKQRFLCKRSSCRKSFQVEPKFVNKHCFISNPLKMAIWNDCAKKRSVVDIAMDHHVSHHTVHRIVLKNYQEKKIDYSHLPAHLCFDEFKSTKDAEGAMSFIYMDSKTHKICDIVEDRRLDSLIAYFKRFSTKARKGVKTIVIDMYTPYESLINTLFPNADIITDRFHIVQLINRALNKTRIRVMNSDTAKNKHYNKLKRYWKLLLTNESNLNTKFYRARVCFKKHMTSYQLAHKVAQVDDELYATYKYYQNLLDAIEKKKEDRLIFLLENAPNDVSDYMKTSIESLLKFLPSVLNALKYDYSNGPLEGTINFIKQIKRTAFGYRSFYNLKARILLIHEFNPTKIARINKEKHRNKMDIKAA